MRLLWSSPWCSVALACAAACTLASACGASQEQLAAQQAQPEPDITSPMDAADIQAGAVEPGASVAVMHPQCAEDAEESCNALDDDCDGQIDEGCGYNHGPIQVTAAWNSDADMDLYVTGPLGETISPAHPEAADGAVLDHAARGRCEPDQPNNRIENVYWARPPSAGTYRVELHYWGECSTDAGPTTATVSLAVGGKLIGTYNYTMNPNQRATVVTFAVTR